MMRSPDGQRVVSSGTVGRAARKPFALARIGLEFVAALCMGLGAASACADPAAYLLKPTRVFWLLNSPRRSTIR